MSAVEQAAPSRAYGFNAKALEQDSGIAGQLPSESMSRKNRKRRLPDIKKKQVQGFGHFQLAE
jgi:hypothetical protein